jgi:hypothetical protein
MPLPENHCSTLLTTGYIKNSLKEDRRLFAFDFLMRKDFLDVGGF